MAKELNIKDLLDDLIFVYGLSWSDVSYITHTSHQKLRSWQKCETTPAEARFTAERLFDFQVLIITYSIDDPANWLHTHVVEGYCPKYIDLCRSWNYSVLVYLLRNQITAEMALDITHPGWRDTLRLEHEVFEASDGNLSIRKRQTTQGA